MTARREVHVGDIGTIFKARLTDEDAAGAEVVVDISAATLLQLTFSKPDGTATTVTATLSSGGADGLFQYTTVSAGFLDQPGRWRVQGTVTIGTSVFHTSEVVVPVAANLA